MADRREKDRVPLQEMRVSLPADRMAHFGELQKRAFALLAASPNGYRRFWEPNLRKRSIKKKYG